MDMAVLTRMAATTNGLQVPDMEPPFRHTLLPTGVGIVRQTKAKADSFHATWGGKRQLTRNRFAVFTRQYYASRSSRDSGAAAESSTAWIHWPGSGHLSCTSVAIRLPKPLALPIAGRNSHSIGHASEKGLREFENQAFRKRAAHGSSLLSSIGRQGLSEASNVFLPSSECIHFSI
jgi:hypothetical protein